MPFPDMQPVDSSNVFALGYDASAGDLYVTFHRGGTYAYHGVSPEEYLALQRADSIGKHLETQIKPYHNFSK